MKHWYIFYAYTTFIILVLVAAYIGMIPTEISIVPMYDSVGHFVLYGIWFYLLHSALKKRTVSFVPLAFIILLPIITIEELAQIVATTRNFSLIDLLWGIAGMLVFWFISSMNEQKEQTKI